MSELGSKISQLMSQYAGREFKVGEAGGISGSGFVTVAGQQCRPIGNWTSGPAVAIQTSTGEWLAFMQNPQGVVTSESQVRMRRVSPEDTRKKYSLVYSIAKFDADGCFVATEIWLGGEANKLLKRYPATHEPTAIEPFYYANPDTIQIEPINGSIQSSDFEDAGTLEDTWTVSEAGSAIAYDVSNAIGGGTAIPFLRLWDNLTLHQYKVDFTAALNISKSAVTPSGRIAVLDGSSVEIERVDIESTDSGSATFAYSKCVETSIDIVFSLSQAGEASSGSGSAAFSGTKALYLYPEVLYAAKRGDDLFTAVRFIRGEGDIAIDYFVNDRLSTVYDSTHPPNASDWRASLLSLDLDVFTPPPTGNPCVDTYREDSLSNLDKGLLRQFINFGDIEALQTASANVQYTEQPAVSGGTCVLGTATIKSVFMLQLQQPVLGEGEASAETTILWAVP